MISGIEAIGLGEETVIRESGQVRAEVLRDFQHFKQYYIHLASDLPQFSQRKVIYSIDFSLLYPYLFKRKSAPKSNYDQVGTNIFSLLSTYHGSAGFSPAMSIPSLLELIDVLAHRIENFQELENSRERLSELNQRIRRQFEARDNLDAEHVEKLEELLSGFRPSASNPNLNSFCKMLDRNHVAKLRYHVDPKIFHGKEFNDIYNQILDRMTKSRSIDDPRKVDDKNFHYKVDSWNLAAAELSHRSLSYEIDHVCRPGLSKFLGQSSQTEHSRHPYVALIRLYSLFVASSDGDLNKEAEVFCHYGVKELTEAQNVLENVSSISQLSMIEKERLETIYNRYIRHLHMEFPETEQDEQWKMLQEQLKDEFSGRYKSILTEEGLREKLKADSIAVKDQAKSILSSHPVLLDERLLGDYDLSDNPRVAAIRKTLDI